MDTRYWGPDAWQLLHSIAVSYPSKPSKIDAENYYLFFGTIKDILPCIYCRISFNEYSDQLPIENYLKNGKSLSYWLYLMHNKVNEKLRNQNLQISEDPEFDTFHQKYLEKVKIICNDIKCIYRLPGWEFMYCVLFNYTAKKNKIDEVRKQSYITFFKLLPQIVPFPSLRDVMLKYIELFPIEDCMQSRTLMKLWCYNLEKMFCEINQIKYSKFTERCRSIELYRAGCNGKNDPKPTCHVTPK